MTKSPDPKDIYVSRDSKSNLTTLYIMCQFIKMNFWIYVCRLSIINWLISLIDYWLVTYPAPSIGKISSVHSPSLPSLFRKSLRQTKDSASTNPPTTAAISSPFVVPNWKIIQNILIKINVYNWTGWNQYTFLSWNMKMV